MLTNRLLGFTSGVAAALLMGTEAVLRGGLTAAEHDLQAVREVPVESREASLPGIVRTCRNALLGQLRSATDDVGRVAQAMREVRCTHRVASDEDGLRAH